MNTRGRAALGFASPIGGSLPELHIRQWQRGRSGNRAASYLAAVVKV